MREARYTNLNDRQTLFGLKMLQSYTGLIHYENVLNAHKNRIEWICEIGTATGSLSMFLAVWAKRLQIPFATIDTGGSQNKLPFSTETEKTLYALGTRVLRDDCFSKTSSQKIQNFIKTDPGFLFCDGGNKAKEVAHFGPKTVPGSIIVAHDWGVEFKSEHVDAVPEIDYLEPWHTRCIEDEGRAAIMFRKSK